MADKCGTVISGFSILTVPILRCLACAVLAVIGLGCEQRASFQYVRFPCSIFDRGGKLIYAKEGYNQCDFASDGSLVGFNMQNTRLDFFDRKDKLVWSEPLDVHHSLNFSENEEQIIAVHKEGFPLNGQRVKGDCVSVRDRSNRVLKQWCLKDHINELESLGYEFRPRPNMEISHTNSVYEIPPNARAATDPAFAPGNYVINLFMTSYAVIILDRQMQKILFHKNFKTFKYGPFQRRIMIHDVQINQRGNLFYYVNFIKKENFTQACNYLSELIERSEDTPYTPLLPAWFSAIWETDPRTDAILWSYRGETLESFKSDVFGSATMLDNGNLLYTDITGGGQVIEVNSRGEVLWSIKNPSPDWTGQPAKFQFAKPFSRIAFLKARGLL